MSEEQTTAEQPTSAPDRSVEDRVADMLFGPEEDAASPSEPQEQPPAAEETAQDAADEDFGDAADPLLDDLSEPATSAELELTYNGAPLKVSMDEAKNLAQLGYHLQKSRETVTGELQTAQNMARQIQQAAQQLEQAAPQVQSIGAQLQALQMLANSKGLTPQAILETSRSDPALAQEMQAELNLLSAQYSHLQQQHQQAQQAFTAAQKAAREQMLQAEWQMLPKLRPELKNPDAMARARTYVEGIVKDTRPETRDAIAQNAELQIMALDAARYRALQASRKERPQQKQTQTLKPGAAPPITTRKAQEQNVLRTNWKKTSDPKAKSDALLKYVESKYL